MMLYYNQLVDAPKLDRGKVSNVIYTLDIETTSLFHYPDGWDVFNPELPAEYYQGIEKASVPYIWQFGIEADGKCNPYYGRDFRDIEKVLKMISDPDQRKIIWIFNAGFEFQHMRDIFDHYTITDMCCRQVRKPIRWRVQELNIEFRCAYMLTGLTLEKAASEFTDIQKLSGDLDYNKRRSKYTNLTEREILYCEYDIRTLQAIIEHYRDVEYGGKLTNIPLTLTGEVRKELRENVDFSYIKTVQRQVPENPHIMRLLMRAFMGGITHACYLYAGEILYNIMSGDMASAYPAVMLAERFPSSRWIRITADGALKSDRKYWATLYHVRFYDIESKLFNNYILASKCVQGSGIKIDNGRIIRADFLEAVLTEVDYDIIVRSYTIVKTEFIECYINRKDYLPIELRKYILKLYGQKTRLKGVSGAGDVYRRSKSRINSLYGCCTTNIIKGSADYINGEWTTQGPTDEYVQEKLEELRNSRTNCFAYQWGVWVTAYCRARTWALVSALDPSVVGMDKGVCYYDTDSCKAPVSEEFYAAMEKDNQLYMDKLLEMCDLEEIDISETRPTDPKGKEHPIGLWENEAPNGFNYSYSEFLTLGAKRYAHRDMPDGELNITVSGVKSKSGREALKNDISNFKPDMTFSYDECGKLTSCYIDQQDAFKFTDIDGNECVSTQEHGIVLQPTTYHMGVDDVYEALWNHDIVTEGRKAQWPIY